MAFYSDVIWAVFRVSVSCSSPRYLSEMKNTTAFVWFILNTTLSSGTLKRLMKTQWEMGFFVLFCFLFLNANPLRHRAGTLVHVMVDSVVMLQPQLFLTHLIPCSWCSLGNWGFNEPTTAHLHKTSHQAAFICPCNV